MNTSGLVEDAAQALIQLFEAIPGLKTRRVGRGGRLSLRGFEPDILLEVRSGGAARTLVVEVKGNGEPKTARTAAEQLKLYLGNEENVYGVLVAPYVSESAAAVCEDFGIGYADLAGNCLLAFDQVFIRSTGNPNPRPRNRRLRSLYSPRSERILRVLLERPDEWWTVRPLAAEASVAIGLVSKVRRLLIEREWVESTDEGFRLATPGAAVDEWAGAYSTERNTVVACYTDSPLDEFEERACRTCRGLGVEYGLAEFSAAARIAFSVRYRRASIYIDGAVDKVRDKLSLTPVETGGNAHLIQPYDVGVFYGAREYDGLRVVSPTQAYLDLLKAPMRGQEAAEFLREKKMEPRWRRRGRSTSKQR